MYKLLLVDDEQIIREGIERMIDWNRLNITLTASCSNAIAALDSMTDDMPDILLTDIRMPGLSGLELIEKISQTDLNIQFILLSGFGEFEYAKQAMRFRVHHYLLKPCNEDQIIESIQDVIKEHFHQKAFQDMQERQKNLVTNLHYNLLSNIIHERIFLQDGDGPSWDSYSGYMDFSNTGYELCFFYYVEENQRDPALNLIYQYMRQEAPGIPLYSIYVKNTLLLFFESHQVSYDRMDSYFRSLSSNVAPALEYRRLSFSNLASLLEQLISKIRRYGTIYFMNGLQPVPICNYRGLISKMEQLTSYLPDESAEMQKNHLQELRGLLDGITNLDFLRQTGSRTVIKLTSNGKRTSSTDATEFLLELNQQTELEPLRAMIMKQLTAMLEQQAANGSQNISPLIENITQYVEEHLDDPNLTLKWISENYLFMNVITSANVLSKKPGRNSLLTLRPLGFRKRSSYWPMAIQNRSNG